MIDNLDFRTIKIRYFLVAGEEGPRLSGLLLEI